MTQQRKIMFFSPRFKGANRLSDNPQIFKFSKTKMDTDKPIFICQTIFELSKLLCYGIYCE